MCKQLQLFAGYFSLGKETCYTRHAKRLQGAQGTKLHRWGKKNMNYLSSSGFNTRVYRNMMLVV